MTTQEVVSPADLKVREKIRCLKRQIKWDAEALRALKLCRATKNPHPRRVWCMVQYSLSNRRDRCGMRNPQYEIHLRKQLATARLIVYGQLREKEHTVVKPERWAAQVKTVLEDVERTQADGCHASQV